MCRWKVILKDLRSTRNLKRKRKKADGGDSSGIFSLMPCNHHISGSEGKKRKQEKALI